MTAMRRIAGLVLGLAVAAGCGASSDDATNDEDVRSVERAIIGRPKNYVPDRTMDTRLAELNRSQKARREVAWKSIAKVLREVNLADPDVKVGRSRGKLPAFRTWYQKDDIERMFSKAYEDHGKEGRVKRTPLTTAEIDAVAEWNANDRGSWTEEAYFERIKSLEQNKAAVQGLGGNARVSYSPGAVKHMMKNYAMLAKCARGEIPDDPAKDLFPTKNFSTCLDAEFPKDAAVIKAAWLRADFGITVPVRPTTPEALKERLAGTKDDGGWGKAVTEASPDENSIYTVKMSDGTTFRLPALHLVTKELREWLWITIWWAPDPDTDFGADRPDEIKRLPGPWKNYKMAVSTAFLENDPDPTGGYPTGPGSLGDALAATYQGVGKASWVSNQYIERGAKNAQTNCIGCHQHAGTQLRSETVLADPAKFPEAGRTKVRGNFPGDYMFAVSAPPDSLGQAFDSILGHYDSVDR
jgi:hypothetical protein